jgi:hypothetical protein
MFRTSPVLLQERFYKLFVQIWCVVIRVQLDTSGRYKVVGRTRYTLCILLDGIYICKYIKPLICVMEKNVSCKGETEYLITCIFILGLYCSGT